MFLARFSSANCSVLSLEMNRMPVSSMVGVKQGRAHDLKRDDSSIASSNVESIGFPVPLVGRRIVDLAEVFEMLFVCEKALGCCSYKILPINLEQVFHRLVDENDCAVPLRDQNTFMKLFKRLLQIQGNICRHLVSHHRAYFSLNGIERPKGLIKQYVTEFEFP